MIKDMYKSLVMWASGLGDYVSMTKTELANGYCDADEARDEVKRNQYYSALMLKYWHMVPYLAEKNKALNFELEDFASWISESLDVAFKYRRWRDPTNELSKDPDGPEKVINQCITSTAQRWYSHFNKNKRKINYNHDVYSLEESYEIYGDGADAYMQHSETIDGPGASYDIVQFYLNKGKIIDALIIDGLAHYDEFTPGMTNGNTQAKFSKRFLVKHLSGLGSEYLDYFKTTYHVDAVQLQEVVKELGTSSNSTLYNYIKKTISSMRTNKEVLNILCS